MTGSNHICLTDNSLCVPMAMTLIIFLSVVGYLKGLSLDPCYFYYILTTCLMPKNHLIDLELKLNHELSAVAEWMKSNRLVLSIVKTSFILFHSKKLKPYKTIKLNLKINGVNILQVSTVKYLGVTFDANLTWKSHIDELCQKLLKNCRNNSLFILILITVPMFGV